MTHQVIVTQRAKDDLRRYHLLAAEYAPETAARWLDRFESSLQTLATNPERCDLAPEDDLGSNDSAFFFGKRTRRYRVLFAIEDNQVMVLHIRRGTMDKAAEEDLAD